MNHVVSAGDDAPRILVAGQPKGVVVRAGTPTATAVVAARPVITTHQDPTPGADIAQEAPPAPIVTQVRQEQVVLAGVRGRPGPPGQPGPAGGSAFLRTAGEPLSALVAVYEDTLGAVRVLQPDDEDNVDMLVGVTVTAAGAGELVTVQRSGALDAAGLGLVPGRVWLGGNGRLVQTPPEDGFDVLLGYATAEQRLYIDISEPIQLED